MTNWLKDWEDEKDEREERFHTELVENKTKSGDVTKRGVFKNLDLSPFEIQLKDKVLKFSSRTKMNKFCDEMKRKELQLYRSFERIYGDNFDKEKTNFDGLIRSMYIANYKKLKLK